MDKIMIIAGKEFKDILRSSLFLTVLALLLALSAVSAAMSSLVYQRQVSAYQSSLKVLTDLGKKPNIPPELFPLNLLRGTIDYIEIVGAILGILLGCLTIAKEKDRQTLKLILSRPVSRRDVLYGKMLGNAAFLGMVLLIVGVLSLSSLIFVAGAALSPGDAAKLLLALLVSWVYLVAFFNLAVFLALGIRTLSNALIVAFVIWLVYVLILPQIGDTMDPDNQVPGGFFRSMSLSKAQEKAVLVKFASYENARDIIEQLSVAKHYERACFALFGIKPEFNGASLAEIFGQKWLDFGAVLAFFIAGFAANHALFSRKDILVGG